VSPKPEYRDSKRSTCSKNAISSESGAHQRGLVAGGITGFDKARQYPRAHGWCNAIASQEPFQPVRIFLTATRVLPNQRFEAERTSGILRLQIHGPLNLAPPLSFILAKGRESSRRGTPLFPRSVAITTPRWSPHRQIPDPPPDLRRSCIVPGSRRQGGLEGSHANVSQI